MRSLMEALDLERKLRMEVHPDKNPSILFRTKSNSPVRGGTYELVEVLSDGLRLRHRSSRDEHTFFVAREQIAEAQLV